MELCRKYQKIKSDYFFHGDDWRKVPLASIRNEVVLALAFYGGELVNIGCRASRFSFLFIQQVVPHSFLIKQVE